MASTPETLDYGTTRRKKPSRLIIWGAFVIALSITLFLGVAFMWGIGATLWGPLSPAVFGTLLLIAMGSVPTGVLGLVLLIVGIIMRRSVG